MTQQQQDLLRKDCIKEYDKIERDYKKNIYSIIAIGIIIALITLPFLSGRMKYCKVTNITGVYNIPYNQVEFQAEDKSSNEVFQVSKMISKHEFYQIYYDGVGETRTISPGQSIVIFKTHPGYGVRVNFNILFGSLAVLCIIITLQTRCIKKQKWQMKEVSLKLDALMREPVEPIFESEELSEEKKLDEKWDEENSLYGVV